MADYWEAPKTDWGTSDGIGHGDLNRMEANISANRDANFRKVQGFGYSIDNTVVGEDGVVTVFPGSCYSSDGIPIKMAANFVKNLESWAQGNGATYGGMASAVTVTAHTWYYAFVIMDPTNGDTEIMFDDNPAGTNVSSGTFTVKRFINSFKTGAAGGDGSFDLAEMHSTGDRVFINPNSMLANRHISYANSVAINNVYNTITLTTGGAEGYTLPAKAVLADLNVNTDRLSSIGFISRYLSAFTVPTNLLSGGAYSAEFLNRGLNANEYDSIDFAIMVDAARQLSMAMYTPTYTSTSVAEIAVRSFVDERLV